jgi:transposase
MSKADDICTRVADGETLRAIATSYGVSPGTILNWVTSTPEDIEQYTRARAAAADLFESEIIESAMTTDSEKAPADRVKIDALKWVAARRAPKRYGDKIQTEHSGSIQLTEMTDDELERRIEALKS